MPAFRLPLPAAVAPCDGGRLGRLGRAEAARLVDTLDCGVPPRDCGRDGCGERTGVGAKAGVLIAALIAAASDSEPASVLPAALGSGAGSVILAALGLRANRTPPPTLRAVASTAAQSTGGNPASSAWRELVALHGLCTRRGAEAVEEKDAGRLPLKVWTSCDTAATNAGGGRCRRGVDALRRTALRARARGFCAAGSAELGREQAASCAAAMRREELSALCCCVASCNAWTSRRRRARLWSRLSCAWAPSRVSFCSVLSCSRSRTFAVLQ